MVEAVKIEVGEELAREIADRQAAAALEWREQIVAGEVQLNRFLGIGAVHDRVHQP